MRIDLALANIADDLEWALASIPSIRERQHVAKNALSHAHRAEAAAVSLVRQLDDYTQRVFREER